VLNLARLVDKVISSLACTGHTKKNGAVSIVNAIDTAPFFCVYPVFTRHKPALSTVTHSTTGHFASSLFC
jgi:hypothetical protein